MRLRIAVAKRLREKAGNCTVQPGNAHISMLCIRVTLFLSSRRKEPKAARGKNKRDFSPGPPRGIILVGMRLLWDVSGCSGLL